MWVPKPRVPQIAFWSRLPGRRTVPLQGQTVTIQLDFEWDPVKARANQKKHGVSFEQGTEVFRDPLAISVFDEDHSTDEDRWITLGATSQAAVLVVIHTFHEVGSQGETTVRIISVREATRKELKDYETKP